MSNFPDLKKPYDILASLGGIGLIPFAPGTFGSIFAWIAFILISHFVNMLVLTIVIIILSIWVCEKVSKDLFEKDHKSIVIDELAGMWVALLPVIYFASSQNERIAYAILALVFFRFFDILKPFPVSYFDQKYKNGFGIVFDDIIAGILATVPSLIILFLLF
ncbi:MAG: phosphatidylglycerophosphatase A [Gammaproteobacteria bacterium]